MGLIWDKPVRIKVKVQAETKDIIRAVAVGGADT